MVHEHKLHNLFLLNQTALPLGLLGIHFAMTLISRFSSIYFSSTSFIHTLIALFLAGYLIILFTNLSVRVCVFCDQII